MKDIVDEEILYTLLLEGKIAGAGLDVTSQEPLPRESKLWTLGDNVLITAHSAGLTVNHTNRFCNLVVQNLANYHNKLPLKNQVIKSIP